MSKKTGNTADHSKNNIFPITKSILDKKLTNKDYDFSEFFKVPENLAWIKEAATEEEIQTEYAVLRKIRSNLLLDSTLLGFLGVKLGMVIAHDWLPTAACDDKNLYFNVRFMSKLSYEEKKFVFLHEIMHYAYGHCTLQAASVPTARDFEEYMKDRYEQVGYSESQANNKIKHLQKELLNIAQDYRINYDIYLFAQAIVEGKNSQVNIEAPHGLFICEDFKEMNSLEIYHHLCEKMKQSVQSGQTKIEKTEGEDGDGNQNDSLSDMLDGMGMDVHLGEKNQQKAGSGSKNRSKAGTIMDADGNPIQVSDEAPTYTDEEVLEAARNCNENVRMARENAVSSKNAGSTPAGLLRHFELMDKPQVDWKKKIRRLLVSMVKDESTWNKVHRRSASRTFKLPARANKPRIDVDIAIDASGSIGQPELAAFFTEIDHITRQFKEFNIRVWSFDTLVYNVKDYTSDKKNFKITDYKVKGGGGTDFEVNWQYLKAEKRVPKLFIMFTDGYPCGSWGDEKYCDTIFVINTDMVAPFGQSIHIRMDDYNKK